MTADVSPPPAEKPANSPPSTAGMTTKVVKGSLWTLAGQVAPLAVSLVTTPFTIRLLGAESYGVLILIGLIPTYLGFADFGMSMASTKFGSEAYAEGDEEKEGRVVRTAALIALCTSVPVAAILMIFATQIVELFNVPETLIGEASLALRIASVTFVVNFMCGIFNTPQLARLRMDLNTVINAVPRILGLIATPVVIYLGFGIVGAVTVLLVASLLNLAGHLLTSSHLLPELLQLGYVRSRSFPIVKFGFGIINAGFAGMLLGNIEKGLLSGLVSVRSLAHYSVAFSLAAMLTMFSSSMIQSLFPAFSRLQADERRQHLSNLYSTSTRLVLLCIIPLITFFVFIAEPFFRTWAGEEFGRESTRPFYFLVIGLSFNMLAYIPTAALMAASKTGVLALVNWVEVILYLFAAWTLIVSFGILGAAIAWSLRAVVDYLIISIIATRLNGSKSWIRAKAKLVLCSLPLLSSLAIGKTFQNLWPIAIVILMLGFLGYGLSVWQFILDNSEKEYARSLLDKLRTPRPGAKA